MIRRNFYIAIFSVLLCVPAYGQNLADTYALGEKMLVLQQYEAAVQLFERVIFFDSSRIYTHQSFLHTASCYQELTQWKKAQQYYNLAYYSTTDPKQQADIQFRQVSIHLLSGNYLSAQEELLALESQLPEEEQKRYQFYAGITAFMSNQYDSALSHFQAYTGEDSAAQGALLQLFRRNEKISRLNPKTARILSYIIPGLGQFYAGDLKNGINSLLLTGGLIVLAVHLGITVAPVDALLTVGPWYLRYYQGGVKNAERITRNKQKRKRAKVYQDLLRLLALQIRD